jgi:hypothetical protein
MTTPDEQFSQAMLKILMEFQSKREDKKLRINKAKTALLEMYLMLGYSMVEIRFAGSCDSGSVDQIDAMDRTGNPVEIPDELYKATEDFAYNYLAATSIDWYNDDGGQGEITFDMSTVPAKFWATVEVNHITSTVEHKEEGFV